MLNVTLRIPKELRDWLRSKAANEARSMNAQVMVLIREAKAKAEAEEKKTKKIAN